MRKVSAETSLSYRRQEQRADNNRTTKKDDDELYLIGRADIGRIVQVEIGKMRDGWQPWRASPARDVGIIRFFVIRVIR